MAQGGEPSPESRYSNLKKSFGISIRPLLTACSREDVDKAFPTLDGTKRDGLHRLFIKVISSLHQNITMELESLCQELQVQTTLDTVEQLIEDQNLDILLNEKFFSVDVTKQLSDMKKDETDCLGALLEKMEEENNFLSVRVATLKEKEEEQCQSIRESISKGLAW